MSSAWGMYSERDFFWFHGIFAGMGNGFFFTRAVFISRVSAKKIVGVFGCFLGVFWVFLFLFGVFVLFGVFLQVFRALARKIASVFFSALA